jgi:hypothetical protein
MAQSFEFAILQAMPEGPRGERVNIGLIVFLPERLDVRVPEVRKLRALTGETWNDVIQTYVDQISRSFRPDANPTNMLKSIEFYSSALSPSRTGTLKIDHSSEYEERVKSILDNLVIRPTVRKSEKQERINTEIAKTLRKAEVLAKKGQTIDDNKVVTKFVVSEEKQAVADFAYKNGVLKVVSTLDLRGEKPLHSKACEKGATLYFARQAWGDEVLPFGVYAAGPLEMDGRKSEIEILRSFAEGRVYNWLDLRERQRFQHALY